MTKETKRIEEYSLVDYTRSLQEHILQGWKVDFDTNEGYPNAFGSYMTCGLVRDSSVVAEVVIEKVVQELTKEVKTESQTVVETQEVVQNASESILIKENTEVVPEAKTEARKPGRPSKQS